MPRKTAIPHVSWRDGRPRFQPGRDLRAAGHRGKDLKHEDGRWFSKGEALDWSDAFARALRREREAAAPARPAPRAARRVTYTVAHLFADFLASPLFKVPEDPAEAARRRAARPRLLLADNTIADYGYKARVIETAAPDIWGAELDALDQPILFGLYEELVELRGLATARAAIAVLSAAIAWGKRRGKTRLAVNPARDLGMATAAARIRFGTRLEIETLVAAADAVGLPEAGDMVLLGVWTGQRQADRLDLVDKGLMNGRRWFRQAKTGAIVAIREAPQLEARLRRSAERRREARAAALLAAPPAERARVELRFSRVVLEEATWQAPDRFAYYKRIFAPAREAAVRGVLEDGTLGPAHDHAEGEAASAARPSSAARPERQARGADAPREAFRVRPCPSLTDFTDQDLRDTAVTWLALAGSTIPEIISVTGHTAQSATLILKHYLARHPEMADSAISKMVAWYDADGETETGL